MPHLSTMKLTLFTTYARVNVEREVVRGFATCNPLRWPSSFVVSLGWGALGRQFVCVRGRLVRAGKFEP